MQKKVFTITIALLIAITNINIFAFDTEQSPPQIMADAAVLMDAKTGQVLFEKNMNKQQYPASITKIMTILLGIENGKLDDIITMSEKAVFSVPRNSSHIALDTNEQLTLEQALMAAMLPSANEACNGIAEYISGSIEGFAIKMNMRATEAGAINTNFVNANGLPDKEHLTTAYDMAMITKVAIQNEEFRRIFGTITYEIPPTNKQKDTRYFATGHKMIKQSKFQYEGIVGGKTGYTDDAQHTLVTVAKRDGRELIVVVMKNSKSDDNYIDTTNLLDYGFNEFTEITLLKEDIIKDLTLDDISLSSVLETKRLIHKSITKNYITAQYKFNNDAQQGGVISVHLKESSTFMYNNLGDVTIYYDSIASSQDKAILQNPNEQKTDTKKANLSVEHSIGTLKLISIIVILFITFVFAMIVRKVIVK